jgi:PEP-CTERM motif
MNRSIVVRFIAVFAFFAAPGAHLMATVIAPIGLSPGSPYQLIFVTDTTTDATSTSLAYYNGLVQAAALTSSSPVVTGATWNAIATVAGSEAYITAPSDGTYPVYNTAGQLVEPAGVSNLYGGISATLQNLPDYDQNGSQETATVWTGTAVFGILPPGPSFVLGASAPLYGVDNLSGLGQWIDDDATVANTNTYALYALSSPITSPVPEPGSFVLLGLGAIGLFVAPRRKLKT